RAAWRGHELDVRTVSVGEAVRAGEHDLLYVGGGQDREQALVAEDLSAKADGVRGAVAGGAALLAVCGGYQLLGRSYRDLHGVDLPGIGLFPLETVAGERRMIGDVLLDCELEPGVRLTPSPPNGRTPAAAAASRRRAPPPSQGGASTHHPRGRRYR